MPQNTPNTPKSFSTKANAKTAVKNQGLHLMTYDIAQRRTATGMRYVPVFKPELMEDYHELLSRGWEAEKPVPPQETVTERHSPIVFDRR